jgi:Concanavalin A-like lectin/glucanases superfamily/PEP-CTERM motif
MFLAFTMKRKLSPLVLSGLILSTQAAFSADILHQWKFNDDTDSVGGASITLAGTASFAGSSLQLPGGGPFANYGSVNIAASLNSSSSLSVESWFTMSALQDWSKVWMFGQNTGGQPSLSYINFTPRTGLAGNVPKSDFDPTGAGEFNTTGGANPPAMLVNTEYHVVTIFDAATNTQSFYINGVLADTGSMGGFNVTNLSPNTMRFGAGYFFGDPDLTGTIDEISVWRGALTGAEVSAEFAAGPDIVAVPEPASVAILGLGGLMLATRRHRRR